MTCDLCEAQAQKSACCVCSKQQKAVEVKLLTHSPCQLGGLHAIHLLQLVNMKSIAPVLRPEKFVALSLKKTELLKNFVDWIAHAIIRTWKFILWNFVTYFPET